MNRNSQEEGLAEYAHITYLKPEECLFSVTDGGFLSLKLDTETYAVVFAYRSFPLSFGDMYISIRDDKDKEIGIIRDLAEFPREQQELIRLELERRYFTPLITSVVKMKEEFGYIYWEVNTDRGMRRFTTRGSYDSILPISDHRLLITDVDGNRFEIDDFRNLSPKIAKQIEALM
ncbi:MAG: DUF1854 domain-containing protein [Limnochordia bacterium]